MNEGAVFHDISDQALILSNCLDFVSLEAADRLSFRTTLVLLENNENQ